MSQTPQNSAPPLSSSAQFRGGPGVQTFTLPDLGEGLAEGTIVRWLVEVGDEVALDQAVVEVETAKAVVDVPSPFAGVVETLHGAVGDVIDVGKPLITVRSADAHPDGERYREEERAGSGNVLIGYGTSEPATTGRKRKRGGFAAVPAKATPVASVTRAPLVISPIVRKLAREHGIDVASVVGSGRGGLITRGDVESRIIDKPVPAGDTDARTGRPIALRTPLTGFRKSVIDTLSRSRREIPEATVWVDVDATPLVELRETLRSTSGPGILALVGRFVVAALQKYPDLNGFVDTERDELVQYDGVNLGIAVQSERGLVVPAVLDAHRMTTRELDAEIKRLTASARDGKATPRELTAGTFTLNNFGGFNVDGSAAIINYPQVAILGLGRIIDKPWVVDGQLTVRKITQLSFVFDHRVCDGGVASGFLRFVADAIENPAAVLADL